jgi:hypothetical protein
MTVYRAGRAYLGLAFLLELCALAALAYWGAHAGESPIIKTALSVGAPLLAAVLWGMFAAPRAPIAVPVLASAARTLVFGAAATALAFAGYARLAAAFIVVVIANSAATHRDRRHRASNEGSRSSRSHRTPNDHGVATYHCARSPATGDSAVNPQTTPMGRPQ